MSDAPAAASFAPISLNDESTVVAQYEPEATTDSGFETEAALEAKLIKRLQSQAYEYLPLHSSDELITNLRTQLQALNNTEFSDSEWQRFFNECIAGQSDGIIEKTRRIQADHIQVMHRDDGTTKNIHLIDKRHIHNNRLQVINQYATDTGTRSNRYDVTLLVNGLPLVQIELKRRGVAIREAFNQIDRYQRDSFWADSGLYEYVQLFVISNGTLTKYYSNTTRQRHISQEAGGRSRKQTSNTFEFTSWWTDAANNRIADLPGFARTFLAKHTLLAVLTRYCVFDADNNLLVMRPYQIVATERILSRIVTSSNAKQVGTVAAGGYIWHTTGSGKTLTSFKAAQLATELPGIDKVLFVVDRKDLDYQTMVEYERFQAGAVNSNKSTRELTRQLHNPAAKIIITTIQKLSNFIAANKTTTDAGKAVYDGHTVIIFDECHRSQFGDMHTAITKSFRNYHLFGFTGTPIFSENSGATKSPNLRTTEQAFGDCLHSYTIVNAIGDGNVLPFRVEYVNTVKSKAGIVDQEVAGILSEEALLAPQRINGVVDYITSHFDQKTKRSTWYQLKDRRVRGFNSLFATASIEAAKRYYAAFRERRTELPAAEPLKIALIYSFAANEERADATGPNGMLAEEQFETSGLDQSSRDFLDGAIADYNATFGTQYDSSAEQFALYYKDVARRLKQRELDMAIVVNMFLTGFDATTLNTLWVDKPLRQHGLIQAFSRTNRILNKVKAFGNIVCFRNLETQTNEALTLFGAEGTGSQVLLAPYNEYSGDYQETVSELLTEFPPGTTLVSEAAQRAFVQLFGKILRLRNILTIFDEFEGNDPLTPREFDDYKSRYLELREQWKRHVDSDKSDITDDVVFEIELVKQVDVNVDYIMLLVQQFLDNHGTSEAQQIRADIDLAVNGSPSLRSKKDLINAFIDSLTVNDHAGEQWTSFVDSRRKAELDQIVVDENLKAEQTERFMHDAFASGEINTSGLGLARLLPNVSRFSKTNNHTEVKARVLAKLQAFFERYTGLLNDTRD